jgi:hypothetical protein
MTTTPTTGVAGRRRLAETVTDGLLVAIVLSVGVMAGAASFNHVHDWTMAHSPAGTASWFGWANAVITELIPTAALIIIARRRRTGASTGYPMFLLITAVALSLTAQLAVAERSPFGWMVSALPACAFFALSKLVFTTTPTPIAATATAPVAEPASAARSAPDPVPSTPDTTTTTRPTAKKAAPRKATPAKKTTTAKATTGTATKPAASRPRKTTSPAAMPATAVAPATATTTAVASPEPLTVNVPAHLVPSARFAVTNHEQTTGRPITADELAARLSIAQPLAASLLAGLNPNTPTTISHANGSTTAVGGGR